MAVNYVLPNWLHGPPDPSQILLHAHQIGAQIAMERARLQQQSQLEQIKLDLEQEQQDRQSRQKQQELEIEKSYQDQQVGLKQKALEEAQQKLDLQAKVAGQKYAAQQRIQQRIQSGEDPDRVYLEEGAAAGASMSGLSGFSRDMSDRERMAKAPDIETAYTDHGEVPFMRNPKSGAIHFLPKPNVDKPPTIPQLSTLMSQQSSMMGVPGADPSVTSNIVARAQSKLWDQLQQKKEQAPGGPLPWPSGKLSLDMFKKDSTYQHPQKGALAFDGKHFIPVNPQSPAADEAPVDSPPSSPDEE